jgi:hypothetical protein
MKHNELKQLIKEEIYSILSEEKVITKDNIRKKAAQILKLFGKKTVDDSLLNDLIASLSKFISTHKNEMGSIKENYPSKPVMVSDLEPGIYKIYYKYDYYGDGDIDTDTSTVEFTPEIIQNNSDLSIKNYMRGEVRGLVSVKGIKKVK